MKGMEERGTWGGGTKEGVGSVLLEEVCGTREGQKYFDLALLVSLRLKQPQQNRGKDGMRLIIAPSRSEKDGLTERGIRGHLHSPQMSSWESQFA